MTAQEEDLGDLHLSLDCAENAQKCASRASVRRADDSAEHQMNHDSSDTLYLSRQKLKVIPDYVCKSTPLKVHKDTALCYELWVCGVDVSGFTRADFYRATDQLGVRSTRPLHLESKLEINHGKPRASYHNSNHLHWLKWWWYRLLQWTLSILWNGP